MTEDSTQPTDDRSTDMSDAELIQHLERRAREVIGEKYQIWLNRPNYCLEGKTPYEWPEEALDTLTRIEHGVFF